MTYNPSQFNLCPFIESSSAGQHVNEQAAINEFKKNLAGHDLHKDICLVWDGLDTGTYSQVKNRVYVVHDDEYRTLAVFSS